MKALFTILLALTLFISILSEINYQAAKQAVMHTERTDADICETMKIFGFDLKGDPFTEIGYFDKLNAFINTNK